MDNMDKSILSPWVMGKGLASSDLGREVLASNRTTSRHQFQQSSGFGLVAFGIEPY